MNPAEIVETVKCHVQAQLNEYGIDAKIVDVAVVGSRCRGLEQEGSDLDVVVELSTDEREDVGIDILSGKRIDLDILEYIPDIKGNPLSCMNPPHTSSSYPIYLSVLSGVSFY